MHDNMLEWTSDSPTHLLAPCLVLRQGLGVLTLVEVKSRSRKGCRVRTEQTCTVKQVYVKSQQLRGATGEPIVTVGVFSPDTEDTFFVCRVWWEWKKKKKTLGIRIISVVVDVHHCCPPGDDEKLILCDECNKAFHLFCLRPALYCIPAGEWLCPACQPTVARRTARSRQVSRDVY